MDSEFWKSNLAASISQYNLQHHHHGSHLEDEVRPDFPCPERYEDFDIKSQLSHLEAEHPSESKITIFPVGSVKVARKMLSHVKQQHGHLLKRHRRLRISGISKSQALSLLGQDLREAHLPVLLRGSAYRSSDTNVSNVATDSLLYSLISNFPASEAEEITKSVVTSVKDTAAEKVAPANMWNSSFDPSLSYEEREKMIRQATERAGFFQDLLMSALLND